MIMTSNHQQLVDPNVWDAADNPANDADDRYYASNVQEGYDFNHFPVGKLPSGGPGDAFQMMDNKAFYEAGLRGIQHVQFPFAPRVEQLNPGGAPERAEGQLMNNENANSMGDKNMLQSQFDDYSQLKFPDVPAIGQYLKDNTLSSTILDEFSAGTSTLNSLPTAATFTGKGPHAANDVVWDTYKSLDDQYRSAAGFGKQKNDIPFAPFAYTYPNFGTSDGEPDYGFQEPGVTDLNQSILDQYSSMLPTARDNAGLVKDLQPIFSGTNVLALEQRPIVQYKGLLHNTLWRDGQTELPDDLRIDPKSALLAGSNIPTNMIETYGQLAAALDTIGYRGEPNYMDSTTGYGGVLPPSKIVGGNPPPMDPSWYSAYDPYDPSSWRGVGGGGGMFSGYPMNPSQAPGGISGTLSYESMPPGQ